MISDGGSDLISSRVNFGTLAWDFSVRACRCVFSDANRNENRRPHARAPMGAETITRSNVCLSV